MPKTYELPSDDPIPPNAKEVKIVNGDAKPNPSFVGQTVDAAGKIVSGPTSDSAKLIDQFGVGKVLMGFVIAMCSIFVFTGLGFALLIRSDVIDGTSKSNENHSQQIKAMIEAHKLETAAVIERDKERAADMFDRHRSLVQAFKESRQDTKDATDATRDLIREVKAGNQLTKDGQEIMRSNSILLEKIVQGKKQ